VATYEELKEHDCGYFFHDPRQGRLKPRVQDLSEMLSGEAGGRMKKNPGETPTKDAHMKKLVVLLLAAAFLANAGSAFACTIRRRRRRCDRRRLNDRHPQRRFTGADFRLWITPGQEWPAGSTRDLVVDSHNYGDFGKYPEVKDYGNGMVVAQIPQAAKTYAYFHSRYSFINEKGVAMGESTFNFDKSTDLRKKTYNLIFGSNTGLIDCWNAQDIALERASTAREAIQVMGDLVQKYGWKDPGETMDVADGKEVWIAEFYGLDLWAAVRIPSNAFFVARTGRVSTTSISTTMKTTMYSPNLKSFAEENGSGRKLGHTLLSGGDLRPI
jgi:hypothetical protein